MDDAPTPPIVFANRVIQQFVDHLLGGRDMTRRDYLVLRLVFRKLGGKWLEITRGNIVHMSLLEKVVATWGKLKKPDPPAEEV